MNIELSTTTDDGEDFLVRAAAIFRALGDPTRLRIFQILVACCDQAALSAQGGVHRRHGATIGELCCRVTGEEQITSTLSFHVHKLEHAGLIHVERRGRFMLCTVNPSALRVLSSFLRLLEGGDGAVADGHSGALANCKEDSPDA